MSKQGRNSSPVKWTIYLLSDVVSPQGRLNNLLKKYHCTLSIRCQRLKPVECGLSPRWGLSVSPLLAPLRQAQGKLWAAFLRRFAASNVELCSSASPKFQFSRTRLDAAPFQSKIKTRINQTVKLKYGAVGSMISCKAEAA
jgi:hypothetical protein